MAAIAVGTASLITILSVFNGFESLIASLFNTFDPHLKIEAVAGKTFPATTLQQETIKALPGVISYTEVVEEKVLLRHEEQQYIVMMKGVSDDFLHSNPLDSMLITGALRMPGRNSAIAGYGVCYYLNINPHQLPTEATVYVPKREAHNFNLLNNAFREDHIKITSIFSIQQDFDTKYVLVPLRFMKQLIGYEEEITSVEIRLEEDADMQRIQKQVATIAGEGFNVRNRFEQQESLYKVMKGEKLAIFLILTFILIIAAFNIIGSQTMVMLDKQRNAAILNSIGANRITIRRIFVVQGLIISMSGALSGLLLGALACFLQLRFGLIKFDAEASFVINVYPVEMRLVDFFLTFVTVTLISLFSALFPASRIRKEYLSLESQEITND